MFRERPMCFQQSCWRAQQHCNRWGTWAQPRSPKLTFHGRGNWDMDPPPPVLSLGVVGKRRGNKKRTFKNIKDLPLTLASCKPWRKTLANKQKTLKKTQEIPSNTKGWVLACPPFCGQENRCFFVCTSRSDEKNRLLVKLRKPDQNLSRMRWQLTKCCKKEGQIHKKKRLKVALKCSHRRWGKATPIILILRLCRADLVWVFILAQRIFGKLPANYHSEIFPQIF